MSRLRPMTGIGFELYGQVYVYHATGNIPMAWMLSGPPRARRSQAATIHPLKQAIVQAAWEQAGCRQIEVSFVLPDALNEEWTAWSP